MEVAGPGIFHINPTRRICRNELNDDSSCFDFDFVPALETRCSFQTVTCDQRAGPSSRRLLGSTATFRFGRLTWRTFTLFKVLCQTNWTSGACVQQVELRNESRHTMGK